MKKYQLPTITSLGFIRPRILHPVNTGATLRFYWPIDRMLHQYPVLANGEP
uniref:Uncharacterized protein n=1 Tax=uncultured Sphingobacterium sp. EB080_L08E11 TaxID=710992 RepID=E0Y0V9_9SPHI|nr:hypothetical protein [uncultured Sphingobacterium sp. EB080_L08E11]